MSVVRDLWKRMPSDREGLENYVLNNNLELKEEVGRNPRLKTDLEEIVGETFDKYGDYLNSTTSRSARAVSGLGKSVGYTADAWMLSTGDIVGSLGGKFLNLIAQIPEKAYGLMYGIRTGNYTDSLKNVFEGLASYLPGLTFADQGLKRIIQKRMIREVRQKISKKMQVGGEENSSTKTPEWLLEAYQTSRRNYLDASNREGNVISAQS